MKSAPGVPLTIAELQLSSPLPSPNRHPSNSTAQQHQQHTRLHHTEASPSDAIILPQLHFDPPYSLNPDLYPLANIATPNAMKKFTFKVDEKHGLFQEIQVNIKISIRMIQLISHISLGKCSQKKISLHLG